MEQIYVDYVWNKDMFKEDNTAQVRQLFNTVMVWGSITKATVVLWNCLRSSFPSNT